MKYITFFIILGTSLFLAGCGAQTPSTTGAESSPSPTADPGFTRLTGELQMNGETGILRTETGDVPVESLKVDLSQHNGRTVTVTGKYSGTTLFVSQIK